MRGKLSRWAVCRFLCRITPADAGKTSPRKREHVQTQDHPRGCGENTRNRDEVVAGAGSPPRMRGKRTCSFVMSAASRITPADAGKTLFPPTYFLDFPDHPRGCGENRHNRSAQAGACGITPADAGKTGCQSGFVLSAIGSPPRMRGKRFQAEKQPQGSRITPADAGKTQPCARRHGKPEDHPRGCGENSRRYSVRRSP